MVFNRKLSVAILGAGHGGQALAAYLAHQGHRVALWNRSPSRLAAVAALGRIHLSLRNSTAVHAPIAIASSSLSTVLSAARLVLVAVPASGHADVARRCAPLLRDGQAVLLLPGRTGGALEFRQVLRAAGCDARILLGEASTFPIASRSIGPAESVIFGVKGQVLTAALPSVHTLELVAAYRPLLPMLAPGRSVLHTGFANLGAILHPVITLLNAARIQRGECFDFYAEGVTPRVADVLAAADAERLRIARAYGVAAGSLTQWIAETYDHHADTVLDAVRENPAYRGIKAPDTLIHRYLLEDVPTGLIPLIELGRTAGVAAPVLEGLVDLARLVLGSERWLRPRTRAALGLESLGVAGVRAFVDRGLAAAKPAARTTGLVPVGRFADGRELIPQL
jgi:opine dehydrogenase